MDIAIYRGRPLSDYDISKLTLTDPTKMILRRNLVKLAVDHRVQGLCDVFDKKVDVKAFKIVSFDPYGLRPGTGQT